MGQYTRGSAKTGRVRSTQPVNAMHAWYRQGGYIVQAIATNIQSPEACVYWGGRIDKCMASGAPADIQTYSASRLVRYSVAISRRHAGPLINKPAVASPDLGLHI